MGTQAGRQRAMVHEGHLLLILHDVPGPDEIERRSSLFWRAPDGSWKSTAGKGGITALREHVAAFCKAASALEERADLAKRAADFFAVLREATPLLRSARNLHKALQEARDAIDDPELISLRDQAYEAERTLELVHAEAKDGLDFRIAERAEQQAETSHHLAVSSQRLNLLAALFFPITALGSVFGMNFLHRFETAYAPWLFWGVVALAFASGFVLRARVDRRDAASVTPGR
jgi:hypothetical protein